MRRRTLLLVALSLLASQATAAVSPHFPGVVRQSNHVYLVENHSSAGMIWTRSGLRGATVLHLDTHDDCRYIPPEKLDRLTILTKEKAWDEIFRLSDISFVSSFQVRPADTLFDIGNFAYTCMANGTVSRYIWVVPNRALDGPQRTRLQTHLTSALRLTNAEFTEHDNGSFSFPLLEGTMSVTTLDAMQPLPPGAILDLDIDFFAFPNALTDIHLQGDLDWCPEKVCEQLTGLAPAPSLTTISASVSGGYLPLMFRFLADACFDQLTSGNFPPYARDHLDTVLQMRRTGTPAPLPSTPVPEPYTPAHEHLNALHALMAQRPDDAFDHIAEAATRAPVYRKGWLDSAEALRRMGDLASAQRSIDHFERAAGGATTGSRSERVHVLRGLNRLPEAERIARELTDWNPDPHLLLLHGGVLAQMQRYDDASRIYRKILAMHPQDYLAAYNLAYVCDQQGLTDEAIRHYRTSIALRGDLCAAHENLGHLLMREDRLTEAEHHLRRALAIDPGKASAWTTLGTILLNTGRPDKAAECFTAAIALEPALIPARSGLAAALKAGPDDSD